MKFLLLALTIVFTSCASIVSGTKDTVRVSSNPSGADVRVDGFIQGRTPTELELSRSKKNQIVRIELKGYEPYEVKVERGINGWYFGNLFFGGFIGMIVDLSTGACYSLHPDDIKANLVPSRRAGVTSKDGLIIASTMNPKPHWKKIGQLQKL